MNLNKEQEEYLNKIQSVNYDLMDELDRLSKKLDFHYYLSFGTLLGAVRHNGFIPWDDDIDILMEYNDYKKLIDHKDEIDSRFELIDPDDFGDKYYNFVPHLADKEYIVSSTNTEKKDFYKDKFNNNPYLDIFFIAKVPNGFKGRIFKYRLMLLYGLAGAHRLKSLSDIKKGYLKVIRCVIEFFGRFYSAQQLRDKIKKMLEKPVKTDNYSWLVANGEVPDFRYVTSKESYSETVNLSMGSHTYQAPIGYTEILKKTYGDYMKLPPVEKQVSHHSFTAWYKNIHENN